LPEAQDFQINFNDAAYWATLLGRLYQRITKYSGSPTKFAVRLDQGIGDNKDQPHQLANTLASDGGRDPLALLIDSESATFADIQSATPPCRTRAHGAIIPRDESTSTCLPSGRPSPDGSYPAAVLGFFFVPRTI